MVTCATLYGIVCTSVSASMIFKKTMQITGFDLGYRFVIWRDISNLFLLSSRLIVVMVVANGFLVSVEISIAKMFVQFEDTDLTQIPLFILNYIQYILNV